MSEEQQKVNDILGQGTKIKIFCKDGKDENSKGEDYIELHFTPVSLKNLPKLMEKLVEFGQSAEKSPFNEKAINVAADIIEMGLEKTHPDFKKEQILEIFSLGGLARAIKVIADLNDFLSQMGELNQLMNQANQTQTS